MLELRAFLVACCADRMGAPSKRTKRPRHGAQGHDGASSARRWASNLLVAGPSEFGFSFVGSQTSPFLVAGRPRKTSSRRKLPRRSRRFWMWAPPKLLQTRSFLTDAMVLDASFVDPMAQCPPLASGSRQSIAAMWHGRPLLLPRLLCVSVHHEGQAMKMWYSIC